MSRFEKHRFRLFVAAVIAVAALAGAIVAGSIPAPNGTITACYKLNNGQLRVVESAAQCNASEQALTWGQQGPQGLQGLQGAQGAQGAQGPQGAAGPGVRTVPGFVYSDGTKYGGGFTVVKNGPGQFELFFSNATFSRFPAVSVSAWGFPGQAPIANVLLNDVIAGQWRVVVWLVGADGTTFVDTGFQFVAAETQ